MTPEQREKRIHYHMYETNEGIAEHAERIVRLEELVAEMYEVIEESDFNPIVEIPSKRGGAYAEDPCWRNGVRECMKELGIEVDE